MSEPTPADIEYLEQIRSNPQIMVMPAGVRLMELVARGLIVVQPKLTELGWRALEGKLELRDTVTHDEDPHGPACDPGDWEANQP